MAYTTGNTEMFNQSTAHSVYDHHNALCYNAKNAKNAKNAMNAKKSKNDKNAKNAKNAPPLREREEVSHSSSGTLIITPSAVKLTIVELGRCNFA